MGRVLSLHNRQRVQKVNLRLFRRVARTLLAELLHLEQSDLTVSLVAAREMTRLNETFAHHAGSTDVLAFDYAQPEGSASIRRARSPALSRGPSRSARPPHARGPAAKTRLMPPDYESGATVRGEILICVEEAVVQARRYRTAWQSELVRYLTHGLLHLLGHDDRTPARRRRMKRAEDRLVRELARRFDLRQLDRDRAAP